MLLVAFLAIATTALAAGASARTDHASKPAKEKKAEHTRAAKRVEAGERNSNAEDYRVDKELRFRASRHPASEMTQVVLRLQPDATLPNALKRFARGRKAVRILNSVTLDVPNGLLARVCGDPAVLRCHYDRPTAKFNYRTSLTTGTRVVQQTLGLTGAGVGVAVIDSGITSWHDDLTNRSTTLYPYGDQRLAKFVDFVTGGGTPHDGDGHGTHVAGIIAGNGYDSNGMKAGAAPDASLVSLRVLDDDGVGTISNIIAALDWVLENHAAYNIRVVNMSVGAAISESAFTDPLTLAAKRVVDAGIVVVTAAGNFGKNSAGLPQYGGISAPANAPWVLTVGGSSTMGTTKRADDTMGSFSSRGPTYLDWTAKPDLVAPGTGTVSLAASGSGFYETYAASLLPGTISTAYLPYLSLSGTSMAAPVVSGTVALMLEANPALTPNAVKAILQYTAQQYPDYDGLTQGTGFLNAVGAVRLARFYASAQPGDLMPTQGMWSKQIIWGNQRLSGGSLQPTANAFAVDTTWGVAKTVAGDNIVWGTASTDPNIVWGTAASVDNIVWGTAGLAADNIVWGTDCGGADCDTVVWGTADPVDNIVWGTAAPEDNIVWGTAGLNVDNIVWGTASADADNVVWGTAADADNIVWGTAAGDNIVWGTAAGVDNIVWGTAAGVDNIVWGTAAGDDNIVWGTAAGSDNIVWGTASGDGNIVWGTAGSLNQVWLGSPGGTLTPLIGSEIFDRLKDRLLLKLLGYVPLPPSAIGGGL